MKVATFLGRYEVEYIEDVKHDSARVRALNCKPFTEYGFGWWANTDTATVWRGSLTDIRDEPMPDQEEDAAEVDRLFADWIDGEGIDYAEYHDQNFHAR